MFHRDVKDSAFAATALLSTAAIVLGDLQMGIILAALAYGVAAWRNHGSVAVLGGIHSLAVATSPLAVLILLKAAPAALAVLPLRESPLAVPAAAAVPLAVEAATKMLSTVRDVLPLVESWPYIAVAAAVLIVTAARRL
ncbi:MAG: hypothetical protein ACO2PM_11565 [Pyrobaculum sp.]